MTLTELVNRFGDTYERKARLYPALVALLPILGVAVGVYGIALDLNEAAVTLVGACGVFYLLANVARELGKRREEALHREWGGVPSVQLQRHRDSTVDPITKRHRHEFLSNMLNVPFPTAADELADPRAADEIYAAGVRWLLDRTRDTQKFALLFKENVAYGYRRNALGLRPIGIGICFICLAWVLVAGDVVTPRGFNAAAISQLPRGAIVSLAFSVALLLVWMSFFTKRTVRTASFSYADMLLRACSTLAG
jgi:hypothetical protein